MVRALALLAFSRSLFSHTRDEKFRLHIWQHSLLTALASQSIYHEFCGLKLSDEAFVAGLMHDTGKVLMFNHNPAMYQDVFKFSFENNCSSVQAEHHFFGFDHCQAGLEAIKEWKLPDSFKNYMGVDLSVPPLQTQVDSVMVSLRSANYLVKAAGIGGNEVDDYDLKKSALLGFGLRADLCDQVLHEQFITSLMENETYKLCSSI